MSDGGQPAGEGQGQGGWGQFATPAPTTTEPPPEGATPGQGAPHSYRPGSAYGPPPYGPPTEPPPWGPGGTAPPQAWEPKPVWALALAPIGALVAAGVLGVVTGIVVFLLAGGSHSDSTNGEGWDVLGHAIVGFLAGMLIGAVAYVVLLSVASRRLIPPGRRVGAVVVATIGSPVLLGLAAVLTGVSASSRALASGFLQLAWLAAAPAVFVVFGRGLRERHDGPSGPEHRVVRSSAVALELVGGLLVVAVAVSGVGFAWSSAKDSKAVSRLPLVLFTHSGSPGYYATPPVEGWRLDPLRTTYVHEASEFAGIGTPSTSEAALKYVTSRGTAWVTMHESIGPCAPELVRGFSCEVLTIGGALGETRRYLHPSGRPGGTLLSEEYLVKVYADGSAVSVSIDPLPYAPPGTDPRVTAEAEASRVLESTVRVGRDRFEQTAHTTLRSR